MRRPVLPAELYRPRPLQATLFVVTAFSLFAGFGLLASTLVLLESPLWLRLVGIPLALLVAAHGAHLLGFVGHEGIHLLLHPNRYVSMVVGSFLSAMTMFSAVGYGVAHWNHHRFTDLESDPDSKLYSQYQTFWQRFFLARGAGTRSHIRNTIRLALGRPLGLGYRLPVPDDVQRRMAWLNLGFHVFWIAAYVTLAFYAPLVALFAVVLPLVIVTPISGLRGYLEHAATEPGVASDTRSYAAPVYTALFFGNNLHLEHHMYPGVPCYNLPRVNAWLTGRGYFDQWHSQVDRTILGPWRHTLATSPYPSFADAAAPEEDPFTVAGPTAIRWPEEALAIADEGRPG